MILNASRKILNKIALDEEGAILTKSGAIAVKTGKYTGRSPNAKFIVKDELTSSKVDWANNQSMNIETWKLFKEKFFKFIEKKKMYIQQVKAGGDKNYFLNVEITTSLAWHSIFAKNMFLKISGNELFKPDWKLFYISEFQNEPKVIINFSEKLILITGTIYAGEMKKSVFTVLNYFYPENNCLPMHCSINTDFQGKNPAIFFGLSGTGKTTLSADTSRMLLGDDEHGWTDDGLCNFEGGCYAKTIRLDPNAEPQIWNACQKYGAILENVVINDGVPDFNNGTLTENTRGSYPLESIENSNPNSFIPSHPKNIIMLTCDAFGVLPPVAKLNPEEAVKQFLLGYTAKVAGTERGITEPQATFSPCFGLPFMPRKPEEYAKILGDKIKKHDVSCWLVNTGWTGGPYGVGKRMPIKLTRNIIQGILNGKMLNHQYEVHPYTYLSIPVNADYIPGDILKPELGWSNLEDYKEKAKKLMEMFHNNS